MSAPGTDGDAAGAAGEVAAAFGARLDALAARLGGPADAGLERDLLALGLELQRARRAATGADREAFDGLLDEQERLLRWAALRRDADTARLLRGAAGAVLVLLPLLLVTGVYGMNFSPVTSPLNMPELRWYWGYPAVLAGMTVLLLVLGVVVRRQARGPEPPGRRPGD